MSDFQCQLEIPEVQGLESEKLTVGRTFFYHCKGDWPSLDIDNLKMQAIGGEDSTTYDLRLLNFELRDPKSADLLLVSYRPGSHQFSEINLTDGTTTVTLPPLTLNVQSVINPNEKVEPFGPIGPLPLSVPWVYWIILVSVIGIVALLTALGWKRRQDRKNTLNEVIQRTTHGTPLIQFHRELRILTKRAGLSDVDQNLKMPAQNYLLQLRELCEIFWGQKYKLALLHHPAKFAQEFKRYAPKTFVKFKAELLFWNQNWKQLHKAHDRSTFEDIKKFTLATRELIEKMAEDEI